MSESVKQAIERATAEKFLRCYNPQTGGTFRLVAQPAPPEPDVLCEDDQGRQLKLEITMLEDRPGDIPALLGRTQGRTLEQLRAEMSRVEAGTLDVFEAVAVFGDDVESSGVLRNLAARLRAKLGKRGFGANVALVLRSTSPLDWDWDLYMDEIRQLVAAIVAELGLPTHGYDRGIWFIADEAHGLRLYMAEGVRGPHHGEPSGT